MMKTIQWAPGNYLMTYYQTLDEVKWLLGQKKCWIKDKTWKKLQILWKKYWKSKD